MNGNRRSFLKKSALLAGMPAILPASVLGRDGNVAPSNRITIGGIGLGPRGRTVLASFLRQPDVRFVAIADVQEKRREIIRKTVNRHYGNEDCASFTDMRDVLARPDIDAVIIATGDRWHATASILAARAGKDVYCEKPCTMSIAECRELDTAFIEHNRVYQAGMQRRNVDNFLRAVTLARSGRLGKLHTLHAGIILPKPVAPDLPAEPEPDPRVIDWDRWLGPAPARPFNKRYVEGQWRYFDGMSAGWGLHDWASHTVNLCQWVADADATAPVEYRAEADSLRASYANGLELIMRLAGFNNEGDWHGLGTCPVRFVGETGWVEAGDFGKLALSDPALLDGSAPAETAGTDPTRHVREFLDCVKSRKQPACNSTVTRHTEVACHAAAISWKLGRKLSFDPATESFTDAPDANALRERPRRAPYTL
jgi:predicted dehydrogenase